MINPFAQKYKQVFIIFVNFLLAKKTEAPHKKKSNIMGEYMSWEAIYFATKQNTGSSTDKLVLLMVANLADENGFCFPSYAYLARVTEMSERSVQRSIQRLCSAGFLLKEKRYNGAGQTSNGYTVVMEHDNVSPTPRQNGTGGTDTVSPYTDINNLKIKQTRKRGNYSEEFNQFWEAYPRRPNDNKWNAYLKWKSATNGLIEKNELLEITQRFNLRCANLEPRYIPMCATWLNQRRYLDVDEEQSQSTNRNTLAG